MNSIRTPPLPKKRKNCKNNADDFVFPSKTSRPTTPTPLLKLIVTQNFFKNLEQDTEPHLNQIPEIPSSKPSSPIFQRIKTNYTDQLKILMNQFPKLKFKTSGDYLRFLLDTHEEHRNLVHFMDEDKTMEFYVTQPKENKPIKVVIKGLPHCTKPQDIVTDLEGLGYTVTSCNQLISKKTKLELPLFLVIMSRNSQNATVFYLSRLEYMEIKVEGYSIRGITQRYRCNNFFHPAANCHVN
ncbi:nucleic-acid-binding protein from transposon X-element [Trichonephila clavipes]|nr:nucleic-acid-binding protein from transposon X-element [Trichonephila clavipes]